MVLSYKPKFIEFACFSKLDYNFFVFAEEYSRTYDKNGNLVYDSQTDIYREYNELNQLIRTRQNNLTGTILQEYAWDPIKEKIFIKDEFYSNASLKSSTYYFDDDYVVMQNSSGTYNRTNIYQDGTLVGYEDFDGKKRYVLPDHKASAHLILNESGDVIEENLFSPFAEPLTGLKENKFSYEAKEFDNTVKDYDFHFRKYQPGIGFTQPDTLIQNVYDPQSLNRYMFERGNPYRNVDSNGHQAYQIGQGVLAFILENGPIIINFVLNSIRKNVALFVGKLLEGHSEKEENEKRILEGVPNTAAGVLAVSDKIASEMKAMASDNAQVSNEVSTNEKEPKFTIDITVTKPTEEELKVLKEKKLKGDKLPDANDLVKEIKKEEKKKDNNPAGSSDTGGGSAPSGQCKLNCNPQTCKATGDAKCHS